MKRDGADDVDPAATADPTRCGCAGKTPLNRVVLPARERVREHLSGTGVTLGPDADAALLPPGTGFTRHVDVVPLDDHGVGSDTANPAELAHSSAADAAALDAGSDPVAVACAFLGDDDADPERLGRRLGRVYASLGEESLRIGKGHSIQLPGVTKGLVFAEQFSASEGDGGEDDDDTRSVRAANVDAVHAFPDLSPEDQARVAVLNALNDVYTLGATTERTVRPVVAAPRSATPAPATVSAWYESGCPDDLTLRTPTVVRHDGTGTVLGASVTAAGATPAPDATLPEECVVLVTRPFGGLASYATGVQTDDDRLRETGRRYLRADGRRVADTLAAFMPASGESFDPTEHLAHVTDASGEGIAGVGRVAADRDRRLVVTSLPVLDGLADAAATGRVSVPDVTVETNGPFAVFATPEVTAAVADRLRGIDGCDPRHVGSLRDGPGGPVDATDGRAARVVERAARWPTTSVEGAVR